MGQFWSFGSKAELTHLQGKNEVKALIRSSRSHNVNMEHSQLLGKLIYHFCKLIKRLLQNYKEDSKKMPRLILISAWSPVTEFSCLARLKEYNKQETQSSRKNPCVALVTLTACVQTKMKNFK